MSKKHSIVDCQACAKQKNGLCLRLEYKDKNTKMLWMCEKGHTWWAPYARIRRGHWCLECSGSKKHTLQTCIEFAKAKDGMCLAVEYVNIRTKMLWRCKCGYIWEATFGHIKNSGSWCLKCAGRPKITIEFCKEIAIWRGGVCLSDIYVRKDAHLLWKCQFGHVWQASYHSVYNRDSWCLHCSCQVSKEQKRMHKELVNLLPNLNIVLNDTQTIKPMDIDIYIPSLKLGIEYDGEYWHYSEWAIKDGSLKKMKKKDNICAQKEIKLIRVREQEWLSNKNMVLQKIMESIHSVGIN